MAVKPKKISIRLTTELEGEGIIVWVYHRKVQVQLRFNRFFEPEEAINQAIKAWEHGMSKVQ